jgi:hypothetical protein
MKQLFNFDPMEVFAKETITVRGELLINNNNKLEKSRYVSLEIATNKEFYTKKEWIGDAKFRLLWILLIRPNELKSGAIDFEIRCLNDNQSEIEPISALLHFSEFYNPKNPWQWKLLKIDGGRLFVDTYKPLKNP